MDERKGKGTILHVYTIVFQQFDVREEIFRFVTSCRARKCVVRCRRLFGPAESGGILINVKRSA